MLTAMAAVENIVDGINTKENIWAINTEMDYHETKESEKKTLPTEKRNRYSIDAPEAAQPERSIT